MPPDHLTGWRLAAAWIAGITCNLSAYYLAGIGLGAVIARYI